MTKKSILLSLGAAASVVAPIAAVVACSADEGTSSAKHSQATHVDMKVKTNADDAQTVAEKTVTLEGTYDTFTKIQQAPAKIVELEKTTPVAKVYATPEVKDIAQTPVATAEYKAPVPTLVGYAIPKLAEVKAPATPVEPKITSISPEAIPALVGTTKLSPVVSYKLGETFVGFNHATIAIPNAPVAPIMVGYPVPTLGPVATPTKAKSPAMTGYAIPTLAPVLAPTKAKSPAMTGYAIPALAPVLAPTKAKSPAMTGYAIPTLAPVLAPAKAATPKLTGYKVPKLVTSVVTFAPREVITGFDHTTVIK